MNNNYTQPPQRDLDSAHKLCIQIAKEARVNLTSALHNQDHMTDTLVSGSVYTSHGKITNHMKSEHGIVLDVCVITPSCAMLWRVRVEWFDKPGKHIAPIYIKTLMYGIPA